MVQAESFGTHGPHLTHVILPARNVHIEGTRILLSLRCICWHRPTILRKDPGLGCVTIVLSLAAYFVAIKICLAFFYCHDD